MLNYKSLYVFPLLLLYKYRVYVSVGCVEWRVAGDSVTLVASYCLRTKAYFTFYFVAILFLGRRQAIGWIRAI